MRTTAFGTLLGYTNVSGPRRAPLLQPSILSGVILIARPPFLFGENAKVIGIFGFFAQILSTMGLQRDALGRGTIAIYTQIIFALILERIFFNYTIPYLSAIGTGIILSAALYTVLTKKRTQEAQDASDDEERVLLSPGEQENEGDPVE
ncbi:hypothetical protein MPER_03980 [Moniliophthora perniciosa FA553]|nr:hypothetical protein MPER_03980 [Moniliophthora perniciosa FA553]